MTPTQTRLIPRVVTVVATMMLVAGVVAMHSFMTGHAPMAQAGLITTAVPHHTKATTVRTPPSPSQIQGFDVLTAPIPPSVHGVGDVCLAVLPALALLVVLSLLRLRGRHRIAPSGTGRTLQQRVCIPFSPPRLRRTAPSLSQLCVLRA